MSEKLKKNILKFTVFNENDLALKSHQVAYVIKFDFHLTWLYLIGIPYRILIPISI